MPKPVDVKALADHRIWLRYDDSAEGEVDLSDLAGCGVFAAWNNARLFESVQIGSHGAIEWGAGIDLCPDAMYMRLTRESPEEVFAAERAAHADL